MKIVGRVDSEVALVVVEDHGRPHKVMVEFALDLGAPYEVRDQVIFRREMDRSDATNFLALIEVAVPLWREAIKAERDGVDR